MIFVKQLTGRYDMEIPPIDMGDNPRCDVIMIGHCQYTDEAIESLVGTPVRLHRFPFRENIGYSRYRAIVDREYTLPYMAIVDSDDIVPKGIWDKCFTLLDNNPEYVSVFTYEQEIYGNSTKGRVHNHRKPITVEEILLNPLPIHKLNVIRTPAFISASYRIKNIENMELMLFAVNTLYFGRPHLLPEIGYYWRMWNPKRQLHRKSQGDKLLRQRTVDKHVDMARLIESRGLYGLFPL